MKKESTKDKKTFKFEPPGVCRGSTVVFKISWPVVAFFTGDVYTFM